MSQVAVVAYKYRCYFVEFTWTLRWADLGTVKCLRCRPAAAAVGRAAARRRRPAPGGARQE